jgi:HAD superfamily hydrolase (TIGR01490 family)
MSQPFAVFDIDGTIFRSSLFLEIVYRAVEKGILPRSIKQDITEAKDAWLKRRHSNAYEEFIMTTVKSFDRNFAGADASKMREVAREVVDEYHQYTYVFTRDLLETLKAKGYFLIAITGSIEEVAVEFTKRYGFDYVRPTYLYKDDNGKYTGGFSAADSDKQAELNKIINENSLVLKGSYAIGDSGSDISMLGLVDNPIAFNPDKNLFNAAVEKGWQIVIERKNMIYQMEKKDGSYVLAKTNA